MIETRGSMRINIFHGDLIGFPEYASGRAGLMLAPEITVDTDAINQELIPHDANIDALVDFGTADLLLFLASQKQLTRKLMIPLNRETLGVADTVMLGVFLRWGMMVCFSTAWSRIFCIFWAMIAAHAWLNKQDTPTQDYEELALNANRDATERFAFMIAEFALARSLCSYFRKLRNPEVMSMMMNLTNL